LAAWTLAYELDDSAVCDRGIFEELSAFHGIVYRSNLLKNCIGYTMFRQEGLMPLVVDAKA
jgi:hypothetical protein